MVTKNEERNTIVPVVLEMQMPFSGVPLDILFEMFTQKLPWLQSSFPSQPRTQYMNLFTWSVPKLTFYRKLTKCWHLISITLCHAAFENYFSITEFQLTSKVKGINKYLYHLVHLHYLTVDNSSSSLSASTMGICALKNNTFEGPNCLVTQTLTEIQYILA